MEIIKTISVASLTRDDLVEILSGGTIGWGDIAAGDDAYRETKKELDLWEMDYCYEDVLARILETGGRLLVCDTESDDAWELTLDKIVEGCEMALEFNPEWEDECCRDEYYTDTVIQYALFGELVFG